MQRVRGASDREHWDPLHLIGMGQKKPFLLRIGPDLWTDLESWARDDLRSVNGQIEYLLRQAVNKRKGVKKEPPPDAPPSPAVPDSVS
jgi:hypothetical protein